MDLSYRLGVCASARDSDRCYATYCGCIPIWAGWLVWTSYGPDREASLFITGALPPSATGRGLSRANIGRTERTARIGADMADSASPPLQRLSVIASCDLVFTRAASMIQIIYRCQRGVLYKL